MKPIHFYIILISVIISISGCSTGKNALKNGDYYEATMQAVNRLRSNPTSKTALSTIRQSYPMALDFYRQKVEQMTISDTPDKFLNIADSYRRLNTLADEITRCPAAIEAVKPVTFFHDQLSKAEELAIAEQYEYGITLMKSGKMEDARKATEKFDWVNKTKPGYSDVNAKLAEAEETGTLKVVVETLPYIGDVYQANINRFYNNIYTDLKKYGQKRFLRYYQPKEAEDSKVVPHHVVKMQFIDFTVGNIYEKETEKEVKKDSVVVGTFKDDKGISHDVYGTVKAKINMHERNIVSRGILEVKILDYYSNSVLETRRFPGEYIWRNDWATFNGDERALTDDMKKMTKEKQIMPPLPQDLFRYFSDPLGSNASSYLKSYFRSK